MTEIFDNIKKLYNFQLPGEELAKHIEFFSESSAEETYRHVADNRFTIRMFPSWTPTFYINLGESYQLSIDTKRYQIEKDTDILILRNRIVERHNLPTDRIFTVKFFPGGLEAVLGINQIQFADQVVQLNAVLPAAFIQEVKRASGFGERVTLLENFFLHHFQAKKKRDHYLQFVENTIGQYETGGMQLNTSQLAERQFATSKTINRYFHRVVGTPPKNYFSILRARTALTTFVKRAAPFDPTAFGYYDLSHFYKDITRFTGQKLADRQR
jgi:AraC-like DNA-binding protein